MVILISITTAHAAEVSVDHCQDEVGRALATEQRLYRSVLFGQPNSTDAPIGHVRFDKNGRSWIKVDGSKWRTLAEGATGLEWSDSVMDAQAEFTNRRGIFETKRMLTSELVPYLAQSYRALQCNLYTICEAELQSLGKQETDPQLLKVQYPGCKEKEMNSFASCHFGTLEDGLPDAGQQINYCNEIVPHMLTREAELLKLVVEYDAGYRSLLQFAGDFDLFLRELRHPLLHTLRQATNLVHLFQKIPCFISSCDDFPEDPYLPSDMSDLPDPFPPRIDIGT